MGSSGIPTGLRSSVSIEHSCGYLLQELQMIWDEVGEDQFEREKVLLDLEQQCLELYRRKVDYANMARARLHQELALAESESTHLLLSLGERSLPGRPEKKEGSLRQQLEAINPALLEMRLRKQERMSQFRSMQGQIHKILAEMAGLSEYDESASNNIVNENDLSLKRIDEYRAELQRLQKEKSNRLQRVDRYISRIRELSVILGTDFSTTITKIHPSLNELCGMAKNIGDNILAELSSTVESLEDEKQKRLQKLNQLGNELIQLWNLLGTSQQEQKMFFSITNLSSSFSSAEISDPGSLTISKIQQAEVEVQRLNQIKTGKMKELFLQKQFELEVICHKSHMKNPFQEEINKITDLINSGEIDNAKLLMSMDAQIAKAKEDACSRQGITERVEKWMSARDEERWLEEYNTDENRYSVSRSSYRNLKRAECARVSVSKIPALVDSLIWKTKGWEDNRKKVFLYDQVPLLTMLEEYNLQRQEKEEEKLKQRLEKKMAQNKVAVKQDSAFSSRPPSSNLRIPNTSMNEKFDNASPVSRRLKNSIQKLGSNKMNTSTQSITFSQKSRISQGRQVKTQPPDFASSLREETASTVSTFSGPFSPNF